MGSTFKLLILAWGLTIAAGSFALWNHANTPSAQQAASPIWPEHTTLRRQPNLATLLLFAHPHCPCTRATLRELERLVAQCGKALDVQVVFVQPDDTEADWAHSELWRQASAIPEVTVTIDRDAVEAERFGARTSGETMLYGRRGELLFQGGITSARGHEGDNAGRDAIAQWAAARLAARRAPVFGCQLASPAISEGGG